MCLVLSVLAVGSPALQPHGPLPVDEGGVSEPRWEALGLALPCSPGKWATWLSLCFYTPSHHPGAEPRLPSIPLFLVSAPLGTYVRAQVCVYSVVNLCVRVCVCLSPAVLRTVQLSDLVSP